MANNSRSKSNTKSNSRGNNKPRNNCNGNGYRNNKSRGINQSLNDDEHAIRKDMRSEFDNGKRSNDPMWYATSEQLLRDSASFSFNNPIGLKMPNVLSNINVSGGTVDYVVPGIMKLSFIHGPGISVDNSSAVNLAARRLYTYVRHMNSGSANYDSPDLMIYVQAVLEAVYAYYSAVRVYGVANVYAQTNRYLPDGIITAMGWNPGEVRANLADFRYYLNVIAAKLNSLAIPNTFNIFKRAVWMVSNVFKDAETIKSQAYFFQPVGYRVYQEKTSTAGGKLAWKVYPSALTPSKMYDILNEIIDPLIESEDIGIMAGDILKAYGNNGLFTFGGVAEDYVVAPVYNPEALMQIENLICYGNTAITSSLLGVDITQNPNTGAFIYQPYVQIESSTAETIKSLFNLSRLMNIRSNAPTPADVMVASRLMTWGMKDSGSTAGMVSPITAGTEIINLCTIYSYGRGSGWELEGITFGSYEAVNTSSPGYANVSTRLSQFDWHPIITVMTAKNAGVATGFLCDFSNVTSLALENIQKLHDTALLSLYNVPNLTF